MKHGFNQNRFTVASNAADEQKQLAKAALSKFKWNDQQKIILETIAERGYIIGHYDDIAQHFEKQYVFSAKNHISIMGISQTWNTKKPKRLVTLFAF